MKSRMIPVLCLLLLFLTACQKQTSDDPVVATYKDTQILQSEVAYEKENQINVTGDKTVSDADALDQILLNLIMLDEAEQRGLSVTQEEVDAEMAGQRKNYEEYEEVRSYIEEWCTKMGITTEQYFDMVAEQLPRQDVAAETARYARAGILRAAWTGIYKGEPAGADDEICRSIPGQSAGGAPLGDQVLLNRRGGPP